MRVWRTKDDEQFIMPSVVIVGGGISGLALAYRLQQVVPGSAVTVLEQQGRVGGKIWTERRDGFQVETGPNGFLDNKTATLALCRDLGLGDELLPASEAAGRNRYLLLDGRLRRLPAGPVEFLRSDLLSWRGKLRFLTERWRCRGGTADESIAAFARRRAGKEVADVFADALVTGIYAGDPELLSLPAAFPRLAALEAEHGSLMKGLAAAAKARRAEAAARGEKPSRPGKMWSLRTGLRRLVETLPERLPQPPLVGVTARRLERSPAGTWTVHGDGQDRWTADALVLACPADQQAALLADLDAELAGEVGGIAYNRVVVVALGYRREDVPGTLDGFGYIAPQRTRRDVLGVQWCSSIFPDRAPAGHVLLRAMCGGWHRAEMADWDDDRLLTAVRADLQATLGVTQPPVFHHLVRWGRAIPQYHLGHLQRVARIEARAARYPGLFLGGNAYRGVALNDCTERAETLALQVKDHLSRPAGG